MLPSEALADLTLGATLPKEVLKDIAFCRMRLRTPKLSDDQISRVFKIRYTRTETPSGSEIEGLFRSMCKDARRADLLEWVLRLDEAEVMKRSGDIERDLRVA